MKFKVHIIKNFYLKIYFFSKKKFKYNSGKNNNFFLKNLDFDLIYIKKKKHNI